MEEQEEKREDLKTTVTGHLVIRDVTTGEVLLNQRDTLPKDLNIADDK